MLNIAESRRRVALVMGQSRIYCIPDVDTGRARLATIINREQIDNRLALGHRDCEDISFVDTTVQLRNTQRAENPVLQGGDLLHDTRKIFYDK